MRKKIVLNYFVDVGLAISFLLVALTGMFKFPALLKLTGLLNNIPLYKLITFIHDWSGMVMSILVIMHIVLHWKWIIIMSKKLFAGEK